MRFINTSDQRVKYDGGKGLMIDLGPGECMDIVDGYGQPRKAHDGARLPAPIEMICPQLRPEDPIERAAWLGVPPPAMPVEEPQPTVEALVQEGVAEGVAEQMIAYEQEAPKAKKAKGK